MAERQRSTDGVRETREYLDGDQTPAQQGRSGGNLERAVGTRDLLKRAEQDRPGATRVRGSDRRSQGDAS
ncbi:hypothetical protein [Sedimentitalea arenosa]|jgi:hypothetical protein|uniref:Uncharacterized protein n=1 Tax=Sedimentitalea arenosa TaxID=2798803 RepID=A0A8J7JIV1_9RHOB|nr:hypothetical protein [Arenibacterium arenosum]MBJ6372964.1 hypothetical protein [Arenibacterium arenosum]